jgi:hypothetical protein
MSLDIARFHAVGNVAQDPIYVVEDDATKNRVLLSLMCNNGINPTTQQPRQATVLGLTGWNKMADVVSNYVYGGRTIFVEGRITSILKSTGIVKNGKEVLHRDTNFRIDRIKLLGDSRKMLMARITERLESAKKDGILDMNATLSAEYLLHIEPQAQIQFNMAVAEQTGRYKFARVWSKQRNFWVANLPPSVPGLPNAADQLAAKEKELAEAKAKIAALEGNTGVIPAAEAVVEEPAPAETIADIAGDIAPDAIVESEDPAEQNAIEAAGAAGDEEVSVFGS